MTDYDPHEPVEKQELYANIELVKNALEGIERRSDQELYKLEARIFQLQDRIEKLEVK